MKFGKPGVIMASKEIPISLRCYPDTYKPAKHAASYNNDNAQQWNGDDPQCRGC